jgi:hypothetical protein
MSPVPGSIAPDSFRCPSQEADMVTNDPSNGSDPAARGRPGATREYEKDSWRAEHWKFPQAHFRPGKCALITAKAQMRSR